MAHENTRSHRLGEQARVIPVCCEARVNKEGHAACAKLLDEGWAIVLAQLLIEHRRIDALGAGTAKPSLSE